MGLDWGEDRPLPVRVNTLMGGKLHGVFKDRATAQHFEEIVVGSLENMKAHIDAELEPVEAREIVL